MVGGAHYESFAARQDGYGTRGGGGRGAIIVAFLALPVLTLCKHLGIRELILVGYEIRLQVAAYQ